MNRFAGRTRAAVTLAALAVAALSATAPFADASVTGSNSATSATSQVPFKDPNIDGWLTFCNRSGRPITSGSLYTAPFAWKTISSAPAAAAGYRTSRGRAALYAYQPIQYVDPGNWSGSLLTGASSFTNLNHPVAQATNADQPLLGFTQAYPAHWDGLVEMRMLFTAINKPELQAPYPAAILRVTGTRWTLLKGGGGSCSQGRGVSMETKTLPKKELAKPRTVVPAGRSAGHSGSAKSSGSATAGHSSGSQSSAGSSASGAKLAAANSSTGISGGALAGIVVGALALVWVAIGLIARRRRRAAS